MWTDAVLAFLAWCGTAGAWLFVLVFLADGATRPGYDQVRQPVSALALGPRGRVQTANFLVCGLLIIAGAFALAPLLLTAAVGVFGLALVASGLFPMDPMRGYPPGTPEGDLPEPSRSHVLHDRAGAVVFMSLPVAALVAALTSDDPLWGWYSAVTCAATAVGAGAFGHAWEKDSPRAGLLQRATIVAGWAWLGLAFAGSGI